MYRNLNLNPLAIEKFKSIPKKIKFDDFEYRHLLHSYLVSVHRVLKTKESANYRFFVG